MLIVRLGGALVAVDACVSFNTLLSKFVNRSCSHKMVPPEYVLLSMNDVRL